ncbi:MAG: hypothetical protein V7661_05625 [Sulfitobacter sp.]
MNTNSFDEKLTELERQVFAASGADKRIVTQRLRLLVNAVEPRPTPKALDFEEDDMRFDNVPV